MYSLHLLIYSRLTKAVLIHLIIWTSGLQAVDKDIVSILHNMCREHVHGCRLQSMRNNGEHTDPSAAQEHAFIKTNTLYHMNCTAKSKPSTGLFVKPFIRATQALFPSREIEKQLRV